MTIWFIFAAMTAAALALILVPLWRRPGEAAGRAAYDVEVYRDQLGELDRDLERGLIDAADADAARTEISRRLLAADAAADAKPRPKDGSSSRAQRRGRIGAGLAVAVPALAAGFYLPFGAPGVPALPAAERQAAPSADPEIRPAQLIAKLREHLRSKPGDAEAWSGLGTLLMSGRRYEAAARALGRASELRPGSAALLSRYGEALAFVSDGTVGERSRKAFDSALAINARDPRARFYLGMADVQAGRRRAALERWRALAAETPPGAPWRATLRTRIAQLAVELGEAPPASDDAAPGPTSDDVAAAARMSAGDRQAMIRTMVGRLAARLAETPDDADGWKRLGRSYKVLGETAKSRQAYAKAAALRPDDVAVLVDYAASIAGAAGEEELLRPELEDVVERILRLDPDNRRALWLAGLRARQSGDDAAARRHWRRLLDLLEAGSRAHAELNQRLAALNLAK